MLIAERIPSPLIKDGVDVIRSMEEATKNTNFTLEFKGPIHTEKIGTAEFGVASFKNTSPHGVIMQKIYVTVKNGYALQFFYSYRDDADLPTFDSIVRKMRVK